MRWRSEVKRNVRCDNWQGGRGFYGSSCVHLGPLASSCSQTLRIRLVSSGPTRLRLCALHHPPTPGAVAGCRAQCTVSAVCSLRYVRYLSPRPVTAHTATRDHSFTSCHSPWHRAPGNVNMARDSTHPTPFAYNVVSIQRGPLASHAKLACCRINQLMSLPAASELRSYQPPPLSSTWNHYLPTVRRIHWSWSCYPEPTAALSQRTAFPARLSLEHAPHSHVRRLIRRALAVSIGTGFACSSACWL